MTFLNVVSGALCLMNALWKHRAATDTAVLHYKGLDSEIRQYTKGDENVRRGGAVNALTASPTENEKAKIIP